MFLKTNTLELHRLVPALAWGYIITADHEYSANTVNRYRFEIAVRNLPLQPLNLTGLPGEQGASECIQTDFLHEILTDAGYSVRLLDGLQRSSTLHLTHLIHTPTTGQVTHAACGAALWLPVISTLKNWRTYQDFFDLPEAEQCPRCRNQVEPGYVPVWRFRELTYTAENTGNPRKRLPG